MPKNKIHGKVSVSIDFMFKDKRKRDIDNQLKLVLDCMKDNVFEDDDMIYELKCTKTIGADKDNMVISVEPNCTDGLCDVAKSLLTLR
jgi:Holliday junction resolvase RusA-like endonuclease